MNPIENVIFKFSSHFSNIQSTDLNIISGVKKVFISETYYTDYLHIESRR